MTDSSDPAIVEIDFGIASVYVQGGPDDSVEDVNEIAEQRLSNLPEHVEDLKRMDFELSDEFDDGSGPSASSFS